MVISRSYLWIAMSAPPCGCARVVDFTKQEIT